MFNNKNLLLVLTAVSALSLMIFTSVQIFKTLEEDKFSENSNLTPESAPNLTDSKKTINKFTPKIAYNYKVKGKRYNALANSNGFSQIGTASWYGGKFHGRKTANGEIYNMNAMTGAHKTLPLVTYAKVTNLENNKSLVIKINDRGPFHGNRILDLSHAAAKKLGVLKKGTAKVEITAL